MKQTATAAVYVGGGQPLEIRRYPVLDPGPQQVRLRLMSSGICGTDMHIVKGRLALPGPMIIGHEFVGRVDAISDPKAKDALGRPLTLGDLVIACVAVPCGACLSCSAGETASCMNFGVTYFADPADPPHFLGGYGEYLFSATGNLIRIPETFDMNAVAAFPCAGPTVIRACEYGGGLSEGELVVVQGTGPLGLFVISWAASHGCLVIAVGSGANRRRCELAIALGAKEVFDYRSSSVEERVEHIQSLARAQNRGDGADVVIEASGSPAAIPEGLALLRTRGRYLVPGQYSNSGEISIRPDMITFKAIRITGSGQYTLVDIETYLNYLHGNPCMQERFAECITHRYTVDRANEALADVALGEVTKAVFVASQAE